ncbi:sugar dehydrogenase complex small subunit [Rhizobium oryzicola]|uniref:Sugar dehydrogenase complex small subunit n=1 Tax=Rhizobium oryzicola TaxID=1232668 RepID=A0ABT8SY15_9HYPH|nr:sugar dehydrogenase complex small subunit [Rhizobium oryzicola]MDO1583365.1 sugar dehydrogenase complex small subunit [Rhizobium oryzicola]
MTTERDKTGSPMEYALRRRDLLRATVAVGGLATLSRIAMPVPAAASDDEAQRFTLLSEFLTGYTLDPVLGARYLAALAKRNKTFSSDISALQHVVEQSGVANMDAFLALKLADPNVMKTATNIVSAWYLGVVGEPEDAELITYREALMYRPTKGILSIPTYGPGPNGWGPKPGSKI